MYKLVLIAALVAAASAAPGIIAGAPYVTGPAVTTYAAAGVPLAYNAAAGVPLAYNAAAGVPLAYTAAHVAAPAVIPAPVAYAAPARVTYSVEPVEQHGYKIVY